MDNQGYDLMCFIVTIGFLLFCGAIFETSLGRYFVVVVERRHLYHKNIAWSIWLSLLDTLYCYEKVKFEVWIQCLWHAAPQERLKSFFSSSQGAAANPENEDQQQRLREAAEGLRVATNAAAQNAIKKKIVNRLEVSNEADFVNIILDCKNNSLERIIGLIRQSPCKGS